MKKIATIAGGRGSEKDLCDIKRESDKIKSQNAGIKMKEHREDITRQEKSHHFVP